MHCVLIDNPAAGRHRDQRASIMEQVVAALRTEAHTVEVLTTTGPGSATNLTRNIAASADVIFACGGDGTVYEVVQALVEQPKAALAIIPLGSANALARHLRLSLDPVEAALQQVRGKHQIIPVGTIRTEEGTHSFVVMAGAGPDGELAASLRPKQKSDQKSHMGRLAYYLYAARLFFSRRFSPFEVEYTTLDGTVQGIVERRIAVGVMAARVRDLGGIFSGLTSSQASLEETFLRLDILRPPALLSLPLWFLLGWLRLSRLHPFLDRVQVSSFSCRPFGSSTPQAQADGEGLGPIPIEISVLPHALRIMLPIE